MGDFKITLVNKTGEGGNDPVDVNFMLFQTVPVLEVESWSSAWKVGEVGYPAQVGPIILPTKVEFYILDKTHDNPRQTGPFGVSFGDAIQVTQANADAAPSVTLTTEKAPQGQIKVINASGNPKPLEFALYKDGRKILSYKEVRPADAVYLAVKPTIYIAQVQKGSVQQGEDFKAVVQSAKSTQFDLFPAKLVVNIGVFQKVSKELYFKLLPSTNLMDFEPEISKKKSSRRSCCCLC